MSELKQVEFLARIRHLAWVCFQMGAGQDYNEKINPDQLDSLINGVEFALDKPDMTPEENHNNWMKKKIEQGWIYGEVKDFEKKTHPDLVSYSELPEIEKKKDIMSGYTQREAVSLWDRIVTAEQFRESYANKG